MDFKERVYSVLVVSSFKKFNEAFAHTLPEANYFPVNIVTNVAAAKRALLEKNYDFVLINTPLTDDFGMRLAIDTSSNERTVVLLIVKADIYSEVHSKVVDYGVMTLAKPASAQSVLQALQWMAAIRERLRRLEKKALSVEEKMEEIRIINRAKWILIENLNMTETDAHRYIEKQAMDRCVTRKAIAQGIINTYK